MKRGGMSNPDLLAVMRDLRRKGKAHDKKVYKRTEEIEKELGGLSATIGCPGKGAASATPFL